MPPRVSFSLRNADAEADDAGGGGVVGLDRRPDGQTAVRPSARLPFRQFRGQPLAACRAIQAWRPNGILFVCLPPVSPLERARLWGEEGERRGGEGGEDRDSEGGRA